MKPPDSHRPIRVVAIDDEERTLLRLGTLLRADSRFQTVGLYRAVESAVRRGPDLEPDVVLMDLRFPRPDGLEGLRLLRRRIPDTALVILSHVEDDEWVLESLAAGADGYLLKRESDQAIRDALIEADAGGVPLSRAVARKVLEHLRNRDRNGRTVGRQGVAANAIAVLVGLTPREKDVLEQLVTGASYKEIGRRLGIGTETVHVHLRSVYRKLQVSSATEAASVYWSGREQLDPGRSDAAGGRGGCGGVPRRRARSGSPS